MCLNRLQRCDQLRLWKICFRHDIDYNRQRNCETQHHANKIKTFLINDRVKKKYREHTTRVANIFAQSGSHLDASCWNHRIIHVKTHEDHRSYVPTKVIPLKTIICVKDTRKMLKILKTLFQTFNGSYIKMYPPKKPFSKTFKSGFQLKITKLHDIVGRMVVAIQNLFLRTI